MTDCEIGCIVLLLLEGFCFETQIFNGRRLMQPTPDVYPYEGAKVQLALDIESCAYEEDSGSDRPHHPGFQTQKEDIEKPNMQG